MDLSFSDADLEFQREVRGWLDETLTDDFRRRLRRSACGHLPREDHVWWQQKLAERGWAAPDWPVEYGGAGFTPTQRYIFDLEMARAGAPRTIPFGINMVAPVIMKFGTEAQKARFLPDILATKVWWCQGYSEPGSGSDLASLSTRAERKGDVYVVNGQKTWTTMAQYADWIFCLVRTSQEEIRQLGISFLLIDMKSPGVSVAPIITLDGTRGGHHEVNSVYFEDVEVPVENLVGEEGKGWTCAKYLLEFERGNAYSPTLYQTLARLRAEASAAGLDDDTDLGRWMDEIEVQINAMEFVELRILGSLSAGQNPGPESSLLKTRGTELQQQISEVALRIAGHYAMPFNLGGIEAGDNSYEPIGPEGANVAAPTYFNTRKVSIYAGSNEIQRNIMAKLVLGL